MSSKTKLLILRIVYWSIFSFLVIYYFIAGFELMGPNEEVTLLVSIYEIIVFVVVSTSTLMLIPTLFYASFSKKLKSSVSIQIEPGFINNFDKKSYDYLTHNLSPASLYYIYNNLYYHDNALFSTLSYLTSFGVISNVTSLQIVNENFIHQDSNVNYVYNLIKNNNIKDFDRNLFNQYVINDLLNKKIIFNKKEFRKKGLIKLFLAIALEILLFFTFEIVAYFVDGNFLLAILAIAPTLIAILLILPTFVLIIYLLFSLILTLMKNKNNVFIDKTFFEKNKLLRLNNFYRMNLNNNTLDDWLTKDTYEYILNIKTASLNELITNNNS